MSLSIPTYWLPLVPLVSHSEAVWVIVYILYMVCIVWCVRVCVRVYVCVQIHTLPLKACPRHNLGTLELSVGILQVSEVDAASAASKRSVAVTSTHGDRAMDIPDAGRTYLTTALCFPSRHSVLFVVRPPNYGSAYPTSQVDTGALC